MGVYFADTSNAESLADGVMCGRTSLRDPPDPPDLGKASGERSMGSYPMSRQNASGLEIGIPAEFRPDPTRVASKSILLPAESEPETRC
jgi:hypothetical protein